jgi:hypothetical protein
MKPWTLDHDAGHEGWHLGRNSAECVAIHVQAVYFTKVHKITHTAVEHSESHRGATAS